MRRAAWWLWVLGAIGFLFTLTSVVFGQSMSLYSIVPIYTDRGAGTGFFVGPHTMLAATHGVRGMTGISHANNPFTPVCESDAGDITVFTARDAMPHFIPAYIPMLAGDKVHIAGFPGGRWRVLNNVEITSIERDIEVLTMTGDTKKWAGPVWLIKVPIVHLSGFSGSPVFLSGNRAIGVVFAGEGTRLAAFPLATGMGRCLEWLR